MNAITMNQTDTVRVEFPLGEVSNLGMLVSLGMIPKPEIDTKGITGQEKWCVQSQEGKAYVNVNAAMANLIVTKLGRLRSRIV